MIIFYAGIRTSWTLSDENVWFKTHRLGGKVWFAGRILMMVSAILPDKIKTEELKFKCIKHLLKIEGAFFVLIF